LSMLKGAKIQYKTKSIETRLNIKNSPS